MTAAQNPLTPEVVSLVETSRDLTVPSRALAIGAHPDDVDFGCGATLAKWASAGCEISVVVCTDGSKGTWDPNAEEAALVAVRQAEQRAAAAALGATGEIVFLGHVDGELESTLSQRAEVAAWIRRLRPEVILGHDPWKRYRLHPDHRHAGLLTTEGVVAARDPKFFPEQGLAHHRPNAILLWEADAPDHVEVVGDTAADAKLQALLSHTSQFESTMHLGADGNAQQDGTELVSFRQRVVGKLEAAGTAAGVPMAEIFKLLDDL